jgi:hypothetical protein
VAKLKWAKTDMGGWFRHEAPSDFGPYIIEKEDTRSYSVWWGHHEIGEADNVSSAKAKARAHYETLCFSRGQSNG